jgi:glycosyltransferase involved in cell wall biosynthesis
VKINYIFRKPSGRFSIETVFNNIIASLPEGSEPKSIYLPHNRVGIFSIFLNCKFIILSRGLMNHITGDVHYISIFIRGKKILTIHDVYSTLQGNIFKRFLLNLLWFQIPVLFVDRITVVSEFTKSELMRIVPFSHNKVRVIYNPWNRIIEHVDREFNKIKPVILHIGTTENKNLFRLCEALSGLRCKLIVVGQLSIGQLESLKVCRIDYDNVFGISNEAMAELYKNCDIVSFPSLYEGFGMPIIEGNMAGRVVLTSNICSMPEIANNAALFVDPFDIKSIESGFLQIINDENLRSQLIKNGFENIKRFNPEFISSQYVDLYRELV